MFGRNRGNEVQPEMHEETPMHELAAIAGDVEAGRITLPPRWAFERTPDGVQLWTLPSGRTFACDDAGGLLALPDGVADYRPWSRSA